MCKGGKLYEFCRKSKTTKKREPIIAGGVAEILDVSRQAVSKWEQGIGYPEVEKLLLLSNKLNISLDSLMATEITQKSDDEKKKVTGTITITSPFEHVIATCHKVVASGKMAGGKSSPQYALFGTSEGKEFFGGEPTTFLSWYANEEDISKEIMEIHDAIANGIASYTLKYSAKTKKSLLSIKIDTE